MTTPAGFKTADHAFCEAGWPILVAGEARAWHIRNYGMEQYVCDTRIAMIYEGTNGVQAMDLAGRKLGLHGAR